MLKGQTPDILAVKATCFDRAFAEGLNVSLSDLQRLRWGVHGVIAQGKIVLVRHG